MTDEERSLVSWEDFQMYCDYHGMNEYEYVRKTNGQAYWQMQAADYILGNEDRHGANFGFYMDNETGERGELYPLMDHDHAFSNDYDIPSQTSEAAETLQEAAVKACERVQLELSEILLMEKPETIDDIAWQGGLSRTERLIKAME